MFQPEEIGRITPDEQADALRTLIAVFATSVVRAGRTPRNAISAEILDIVDEVPAEDVETVAQLFSMLALRLRRRARPRRTVFRLSLETALLAHAHAGGVQVANEPDYLDRDRPDMAAVEDALGRLERQIVGIDGAVLSERLGAEAIAAALMHEERACGHADADHEGRDLAVAEFLLRAAAQYLKATSARRPGAPGTDRGDEG